LSEECDIPDLADILPVFLMNYSYPHGCTENSKQKFPEMKLRGLIPNSHIHVSVSDLYIPWIEPHILQQQIGGPIVGTYKSLTDT
jgi:hypothetical protein